MTDRILALALTELREKHGCHTIILYGSRSRDDWTEESDYDLIGFRDGGERLHDARVVEGKYLDAFVYPTQDVLKDARSVLMIRGGTVLLDKDGFGSNLLMSLEQVFAEGPLAGDGELQALRVWVEKMLVRSAKGDLEGNYRRTWLSRDLLECYFVLRRRWYLGPKNALRWLNKHDYATHALFERALRPGAAFADLERLARRVLAS